MPPTAIETFPSVELRIQEREQTIMRDYENTLQQAISLYARGAVHVVKERRSNR
ncbi:MAG: hypothetical protein AAF662_16095 [Pseudomonadota bacterium]